MYFSLVPSYIPYTNQKPLPTTLSVVQQLSNLVTNSRNVDISYKHDNTRSERVVVLCVYGMWPPRVSMRFAALWTDDQG